MLLLITKTFHLYWRFFAWIWLQQCNLVKRFTAEITAETHCGNYRISLPLAKIPSNQFFTNLKLTWRKRICMSVNFTFFTLCGKLLFHFCNNFVNQLPNYVKTPLKDKRCFHGSIFVRVNFALFHIALWSLKIYYHPKNVSWN